MGCAHLSTCVPSAEYFVSRFGKISTGRTVEESGKYFIPCRLGSGDVPVADFSIIVDEAAYVAISSGNQMVGVVGISEGEGPIR